MDHKFIALRRESRIAPSAQAEKSVSEARASLIETTPDGGVADELEQLGLRPVDPCAGTKPAKNSFWPLCRLDAYIVETSSARMAQRAQAILAEDYLIVPDAPMMLPLPQAGSGYARLPKDFEGWPEESGVQVARAAGLTGKGVKVCVLDTGVDADHRELRKQVIDFRYVPLAPRLRSPRDVRGFDVDGHGTHVCGIIAGQNVGIAPDVDLMVAAVLESESLRTSLERVVVALDWVLAQFEEPAMLDRPMIINMSLGFTRAALSQEGYDSAVKGFQQILGTLINDYRVLPIVAVGNEGPGSMRAPAYFDGTLSVGAVDFDGNVASFSGGGVSALTGEVEPNIAGYGVDVLSSYERTIRNRSIYQRMSGTSMATPYVTGIAALYASEHSDYQGEALWQRLVNSALPLKAASDRVGAGLARFVQEE